VHSQRRFSIFSLQISLSLFFSLICLFTPCKILSCFEERMLVVIWIHYSLQGEVVPS
jgi:hypothetical protein